MLCTNVFVGRTHEYTTLHSTFKIYCSIHNFYEIYKLYFEKSFERIVKKVLNFFNDQIPCIAEHSQTRCSIMA